MILYLCGEGEINGWNKYNVLCQNGHQNNSISIVERNIQLKAYFFICTKCE